MKRMISCLALVLALLVALPLLPVSAAEDALVQLDSYDVVWDTVGTTGANGSTPIGNGDIGANVWTEQNGDLLLLLSKTDAFDENMELIKLGRVRIHLDPSPFLSGNPFRQTLRLRDGALEIVAGTAAQPVTIRVWADANNPVIRVTAESDGRYDVQVSLELWRNSERTLQPAEYPTQVKESPNPIKVYPDTVVPHANQIVWYHRNPTSIWESTLDLQGLESLKERPDVTTDPLINRTSGAIIKGEGLTSRDERTLAASDVSELSLGIYPYVAQTNTAEAWLSGAEASMAKADSAAVSAAYAAHQAWWRDFWEKSYIYVTGDADAEAVTRGYVLQRYMAACASRGAQSNKFNGSIFVVGTPDNPDARAWGGGQWFQNSRFIYWPMLQTGDYEMMKSFFDHYMRALPIARERTRLYYGHAGAYFPETTTLWGTHSNYDYGWNRTGYEDDPTYVNNSYVRWHWESGIELVLMMLDYYDYSQEEAFVAQYLEPMAKEILTFYDQHYPKENGKIVIWPAQALESFHDATNPTPEIAGLTYVTDRILSLAPGTLSDETLAVANSLSDAMPAVPTREKQGTRVISHAERYVDNRVNSENPDLYAIFPFKIYGMGKPDLALARDSFALREIKNAFCWYQDGVQAALVGDAETAKQQVINRFTNVESGMRFPAMWAKGNDEVPDMDNGGNAMLALQNMVMQAEGDRILLAPAWPDGWDVKFKLAAPGAATVEGEIVDGSVAYDVTGGVRELDVQVARPAPFALIAPADGNTDVEPTTLTLTWEDAYFTDQFRLVVSENADLSAPVVDEVVRASGHVVDTLAYDTTYYWRVAALTRTGEEVWNSGEAMRFTTHAITAQPATPAAPAADTVVGVAGVTLIWPRVPFAERYSILRREAGTDNATSVAQDITGTTWQDRTVQLGKRYEYAVTAENRFGSTTSAWTEAYVKAIPALFYEDFENGFNQWEIVSGTPQAVETQSYSGQKSFGESADAKLSKSFGEPLKKVIVAYYYDPNDGQPANTFLDPFYRAPGNEWDYTYGLGVDTTLSIRPNSATHYSVSNGENPDPALSSHIARSEGWHQFVWDFRGNTVQRYIDGELVFTPADWPAYFEKIELGWMDNAGTSAGYYDSVMVCDLLPWEVGVMADLSSISCDGVPLANFAPGQVVYQLPVVNNRLPVITAQAVDPDAAVAITQPNLNTMKALIEVTAADGVTKKTYTLLFGSVYEDFEGGFDKWTVLEGTPQTVAGKGIANSQAMGQTTDCTLYREFDTPQKNVTSIWFYDAMDGKPVHAFMDFGIPYEFDTWDFTYGLGVNTSATVYGDASHYLEANQQYTWSTGVPRSKGWHQFVWDFRGDKLVRYIDGVEIPLPGDDWPPEYTKMWIRWRSGNGNGDGYYFDKLEISDTLPWENGQTVDVMGVEFTDAQGQQLTDLSGGMVQANVAVVNCSKEPSDVVVLLGLYDSEGCLKKCVSKKHTLAGFREMASVSLTMEQDIGPDDYVRVFILDNYASLRPYTGSISFGQ